jgi:hypothetical protein
MTLAESKARLDLLMIQAKYDGGGMPPALYSVLKQIEVDIAWLQHRERFSERPAYIRRSSRPVSSRRPQAQA